MCRCRVSSDYVIPSFNNCPQLQCCRRCSGRLRRVSVSVSVLLQNSHWGSGLGCGLGCRQQLNARKTEPAGRGARARSLPQAGASDQSCEEGEERSAGTWASSGGPAGCSGPTRRVAPRSPSSPPPFRSALGRRGTEAQRCKWPARPPRKWQGVMQCRLSRWRLGLTPP